MVRGCSVVQGCSVVLMVLAEPQALCWLNWTRMVVVQWLKWRVLVVFVEKFLPGTSAFSLSYVPFGECLCLPVQLP